MKSSRIQSLKVLLVEDVQDDADLLLGELRRCGYAPDWQRVETEPEFLAALEGEPDIILSDFAMPEFSGMRALDLLRQSGRTIPFILVSGTMGEETAVEAMHRGASDYLLKDRIARLGSAVERALEAQRLREERRHAENALRESEERFRQLAENIQEVFWITNLEKDQVLYVSPAYRTVWGRDCESLYRTPESWFQAIHPDDRKRVREMAILNQAKGTYDEEFRVIRPNGRVRWVRDRAFPVTNGDGHVFRIVGVAKDVTDRKRAEHRIQETVTFVHSIMDSLVAHLIVLDGQANIIAVNEAWRRFARNNAAANGPQDHLGKNYLHACEGALNGEDGELAAAACNGIRDVMQRRREEFTLEYPCHFKERRMWFLMRVSPLANSKAGVVITHENITDRRLLEDQLRQAQKMEGIGQLASGVAHDFNNLLTVIQGNASLLLLAEEQDAKSRDSAQQILQAAERAAGLTRQLLTFSRKQVLQATKLDLNEVVGNILRMLQRILGADIMLDSDCEPQLPLIHADSGMIEQVLLNLAVNSRDAMPDGGTLQITTRREFIDAARAAEHRDATAGLHVCLSVSDTGSGIAPEVLPHIFEPFFTTKEPGKGTGLGLATVYGIIKQHRGWIETTSTVGTGTRFRIFLPAIAGEQTARNKTRPSTELPSGTETVLVAEDEALLRSLVVNLLQRCGYTVLQAESGVAAVEVWNQHRDQIHLLLTDLVMPDGLTGHELARKLRAERRHLKVIYTSGYSAELAGPAAALIEGINFIQKPYNPQKLCPDRPRLPRSSVNPLEFPSPSAVRN